jgi:hypothetical protein
MTIFVSLFISPLVAISLLSGTVALTCLSCCFCSHPPCSSLSCLCVRLAFYLLCYPSRCISSTCGALTMRSCHCRKTIYTISKLSQGIEYSTGYSQQRCYPGRCESIHLAVRCSSGQADSHSRKCSMDRPDHSPIQIRISSFQSPNRYQVCQIYGEFRMFLPDRFGKIGFELHQ